MAGEIPSKSECIEGVGAPPLIWQTCIIVRRIKKTCQPRKGNWTFDKILALTNMLSCVYSIQIILFNFLLLLLLII